ncbi:LytR C-terminal domain-containing protein [candidate division KSB1 bacterium]|nr:LytR C-terminal domain-containing protein [candidate division KSB1 bacterium]
MKRQTRMAKKRKTPGAAPRRQTAGRKKQEARNLRQTLYSLALWALGAINVVFIASFVMKYIPSEGEQLNVVETSVSNQAATLKIEVLNGCGAPGIGKKFADFFEKSGFTTGNVDNFDNFDMPTTIIIDRKSTNKINGLRVAESLGLPATVVVYQEKESVSEDVTIVIGKDYPKISLGGQ